MASTVPRARVAYWPHEQVQKGIRQTNASGKYRGPLLRERTSNCIALRRRQAASCSVIRPGAGRAQAAICGIETAIVAALTLGRISWCVTIENLHCDRLQWQLQCLGFSALEHRSHLLPPSHEHNCCLASRAYRTEPAEPQYTSFQPKRHVAILLLACLSRET